jgi:hypothetical protein
MLVRQSQPKRKRPGMLRRSEWSQPSVATTQPRTCSGCDPFCLIDSALRRIDAATKKPNADQAQAGRIMKSRTIGTASRLGETSSWKTMLEPCKKFNSTAAK